jgi:hypothetical protein
MSDLERDPNKVPQRTWMGMPVNCGWTINIHELLRRLRVVG